MRKIFVLLMAMLMCVGILAGCGSDNGSSEKVKGEMYDAGEVSALVPEGWLGCGVVDAFAEVPEGEDPAMLPDRIQIIKDGQYPSDVFSKPFVDIQYYGPDIEMVKPSKDFYEDVKDLDPFTAGDYEWTGFTGVSYGDSLAILWAEDGDDQYQVVIWLEKEDVSISPDDAEVRAILASIEPSK